ncbi:MAG: diguanylate cyclase [Phycisphaerae bacterium]|jgi:diguanylate cyclase (GGDEF)-like protein
MNDQAPGTRQTVDPRTPRPRFIDTLLSLQFKATALVVVLTLSVTALVSGYLLQSSARVIQRRHDAQSVQMASMLAAAAAPRVAEGDLAALQALADDAADGDPLLYVIFSDIEGRELAVAQHHGAEVLRQFDGATTEHLPVPGRPVSHRGSANVPVFLDVTYPIALREANTPYGEIPRTRLLGYARTGMVASEWHRSMASTLDLVIGVGLLAVVAAIPLGFVLVRRLVSPLEGLADAMFRFSQGDLDVRSSVGRRDEIGRLARAFNRMADQQKQHHERVVRLNEELEKRVAQRTQQLRELASREPLTALYNRRYFNETLERRFSEALRYETDLTCVMFDLDGFKVVNDSFGHQVGDELLILTATTISSQLRSADVAARFGGDEFIVLLPQTDADRALILAERIVERFTDEVRKRLPQVHVSMSIGIASLSDLQISDAESLVRTADHALYDAKGMGKDRIITATSAFKPTPV